MEIRKVGNIRIENISQKNNSKKTEKADFNSLIKDTSEISNEAKLAASGKVDLEEIKKKIDQGYYNKPEVIKKTAQIISKII